MKFKDLMTGNILESENNEVVNQFQKHMDRYEPYNEPEQRKAGRPPKSDTEE